MSAHTTADDDAFMPPLVHASSPLPRIKTVRRNTPCGSHNGASVDTVAAYEGVRF